MLKKKIINFFLTIGVLIYIVFEELIWERFAQPIIDYFNRLKILSTLERYLHKIDGKIILVLFIMIFVLVELQGIYAGALFLQGKFWQGALLYAGKIPIAAFTFWLFRVNREKLLKFGWFRKSYYFIVGVMDRITKSTIYTNIKTKTAIYKTKIKALFKQDKSIWKQKIKVIYKRVKALLRV